jgi:hypothetical protein
MFILSSENFLQTYKRAQYLKQYTSFRKNQGEEIKSKSVELVDFNAKLNVQKMAKKSYLLRTRGTSNACKREASTRTISEFD